MAPTRLYTSTQIEPEALRVKLTTQVLQVLRNGYDFRIRGNLPAGDSVYVDAGATGSYTLWVVTDNGGEFNIGKVNDPETRSIPYIEKSRIVDAGTVAYRIAMAIKDRPVDYEARFPDLVEDFGS